jgi:hypothetical protein
MKIISLSNPSGAPFSHVNVSGNRTISRQSSSPKANDARFAIKRPTERNENLIMKT